MLTYKGHPVRFVSIPRIWKIMPGTPGGTASATIIDHNGVEREARLAELIIQK